MQFTTTITRTQKFEVAHTQEAIVRYLGRMYDKAHEEKTLTLIFEHNILILRRRTRTVKNILPGV